MTGFLLRALLIGGVSVWAACGGVPTAPVDDGVRFLYIQGSTVLAPGESANLRAYEIRSGQSIRDVTASVRWATSDSSVATIQQGLLRGVVSGKTSVGVNLQGTTGSAEVQVIVPAAAMSDVRGQFAGTLTFTGCTRLAGQGPSPCRDRVGRTFPLELTLIEQSGVRVNGTLLVIERTTGPVSGYLDITGELNLSGTLGIGDEPLARMIRRLRLRFDGTRLTGAGESDIAMITGFGPQFTKDTFNVEATLR